MMSLCSFFPVFRRRSRLALATMIIEYVASQQTAHLRAQRIPTSNHTSFELAKFPPAWRIRSWLFRRRCRFGSLSSTSISTNTLASTEATISDMIETVLYPDTNYRVVAWLKSTEDSWIQRRTSAEPSLVVHRWQGTGDGAEVYLPLWNLLKH
jgi:hypothetical protein